MKTSTKSNIRMKLSSNLSATTRPNENCTIAIIGRIKLKLILNPSFIWDCDKSNMSSILNSIMISLVIQLNES